MSLPACHDSETLAPNVPPTVPSSTSEVGRFAAALVLAPLQPFSISPKEPTTGPIAKPCGQLQAASGMSGAASICRVTGLIRAIAPGAELSPGPFTSGTET